ncbi:nucleotidyltransferase domain-containing protein [bacterium]|nr:nucleotidyltransferase domain-containing protein [bacterium]
MSQNSLAKFKGRRVQSNLAEPPKNVNSPSPTTTSLAALRTQRHAQWLRAIRLSLQDLVESNLERPDQIYLFGSRARGDWDGLSDTDLLVVAANQHLADIWVDQVLDSSLAEDVIGLDREAWAKLPQSNSVVWRNAAKVAIPLLAERP